MGNDVRRLEYSQSDPIEDSTIIASSLTEKDGEKIVICHAKKKHLPVVFLQFVRRVGVWPRVLVSDGASEIREAKLQRQLLTRSCKDQVAARGAHHENGPADRAVQEIDTMLCASIVSSGIPMREWCFVAQHISLVDAMTRLLCLQT